MALHLRILVRLQLSLLLEDFQWNTQLANIVQVPRDADFILGVAIAAVQLRKLRRHVSHAGTVSLRKAAVFIDDIRNQQADLQKIMVIQHHIIERADNAQHGL